MTPYAIRNYQQAQSRTADQRTAILYLYDAAIRNCRQAAEAIEGRRPADKTKRLDRALWAVVELAGALDFEQGGALARRLNLLYAYVMRSLVAANGADDASPIRSSLAVLRTLREGWEHVATSPRPKVQTTEQSLALNA